MAAAAPQDRVRFEGSQPILRVENMQAALRFYVDVLGFEKADWGTEDFTSISRDGAAIYLSRGDQGRGGAWIWIGVEDAQKLHEELKARGVTIREPDKLPLGSRVPRRRSRWKRDPLWVGASVTRASVTRQARHRLR